VAVTSSASTLRSSPLYALHGVEIDIPFRVIVWHCAVVIFALDAVLCTADCSAATATAHSRTVSVQSKMLYEHSCC
jgi:hypothetical protein